MAQPVLATPRLTLRPFEAVDAACVQQLAGEFAVADTTLSIPHPYLDGMAEIWIATHAAAWEERSRATFAIVRPADGLVGAIGLQITAEHARGELGYWIGRPFWGQGLATEAAREMVRFGFEDLELNRIQARYFTRNAASGRVMEKLGMTFEGVHREYFRRHERFEDVAQYAILRRDWSVGSDPAIS